MKMVHNSKALPAGKVELLAKAVSMEVDGELAGAASAYEKLVKAKPLDENAWNRLMIIYRKLKDYKKELETINTAINTFEDRLYKKSRIPGKKLTQLSTAILKATGLADKKGKGIYQPEPLARWTKRKNMVLKRLKK